MKYAFGALGENLFSRKFGGTVAGVADPYVSGYHFIWFDRLPPGLENYTRNGVSGISGQEEIRSVLAASCLSVTPPGGTLSKIEFTGLGGVKWSVPGTLDFGTSVSIKFLEMNKTPVYDIIHSWVKMIRDYRTGATDLVDGTEGEGYTKKSYAGLLYYWTTAPDGKTVEYSACYDGIYPLKDPADLFSSDVETNGRLDMDIEFSLDYAWHEPWVREKCQGFANAWFMESKDTIKKYGETY